MLHGDKAGCHRKKQPACDWYIVNPNAPGGRKTGLTTHTHLDTAMQLSMSHASPFKVGGGRIIWHVLVNVDDRGQLECQHLPERSLACAFELALIARVASHGPLLSDLPSEKHRSPTGKD